MLGTSPGHVRAMCVGAFKMKMSFATSGSSIKYQEIFLLYVLTSCIAESFALLKLPRAFVCKAPFVAVLFNCNVCGRPQKRNLHDKHFGVRSGTTVLAHEEICSFSHTWRVWPRRWKHLICRAY